MNTTYTIKKFPKNIYCYNNEPVEIKPIANIADTLKSILYFKVKISSNKCNIKVYKSGILKKLIGETTFTSPVGKYLLSMAILQYHQPHTITQKKIII